ncbi:MAG: ATP-binding domain-containing protein [Adlercreutzia equolifaciens]
MQDLTPVQHEAISRLFRCDRTILGDVNQLSWTAVRCRRPRRWRPIIRARGWCGFMTSYRSTSEITELAARVMPVAGLVAVQRHGEAVRFARCGDTVGVLAAVDEAIERWRASGRRTLGVIAKSDFLAARYAELIARDHDLTLLTDETDAYPGGIVVSSVRLAKGLEFDEAVLLDADGRQYATEADRNLLYVAVTRAMHALTVLYRDEPSPFLGAADRYPLRPSR